jgi:NADH dehydrogenase [ubiquinone] 1 alpha subcomplex assembly factor 6
VEKAFGVFMPSVATQSWLDRLEKVDFDIFDASLRSSDWKLPWKAYWAYSRRKI